MVVYIPPIREAAATLYSKGLLLFQYMASLLVQVEKKEFVLHISGKRKKHMLLKWSS